MFSPFWSGLLCGLFVLASFLKFRDILHPQFIFTISWIYLMPLGAILSPLPANDLELIHNTDEDILKSIHIYLHTYFTIVFVATLFLCKKTKLVNAKSLKKSFLRFSYKAQWVSYFGIVILGLQFLRQLSSCDWSLDTWINYTLGPRFGRPWGGKVVGGGEFIFTLLSSFLPLAGISLSFGINFAQGFKRLTSMLALLLLLFIQVGDGSRTPMALTLLSFGGIWWITNSKMTRYVGVALTLSIFVILVSLMSTFRDEGLSSMNSLEATEKLEYHQDDNYFRLVNTILVADSGLASNWNASEFLSAALLNPIPRFFWPGKPLLEQDFYGQWKWSFVTITYLGELIAMYGKELGFFFGLLFSVVLFLLFQKAYGRLSKPGGLVVYIGLAFYFYMAQRSIFNIGMYSTFLAALIGFSFIMSRISGKRISSSRGNSVIKKTRSKRGLESCTVVQKRL